MGSSMEPQGGLSGGQLKWYKGNIHAHTDRSDGRLPPSALVDWYAARDYDFLAITDHGRVTRLNQNQRSNGMLLLPGAEVTAWDEKAQAFHHLLALLNADELDTVTALKMGPPQQIVDQLVAGGAVVFSAHPYWLGLSSAETGALRGTSGIEVYNHLCQLERARGYSEQHWDELLLAGKRMWGIAVDDCHWREPDSGGGWVMVRAGELTPGALLASIRRGDFYSTQGPQVTRFEVVGDRTLPTGTPGAAEVVIDCSPCRKIVFFADRWLGSVVLAESRGGGMAIDGGALQPSGGEGRGASLRITLGGTTLMAEKNTSTSPGTRAGAGPALKTARYRLTGKETYVRAMCIDDESRKAWTNPIMLPPVTAPGPAGR